MAFFWQQQSNNIIDLLRTAPSQLSFSQRMRALSLSEELEEKVIEANTTLPTFQFTSLRYLSEKNEKELATEVLLYRHRFTSMVFENRTFRQAALTIIQNIYLFKQRKIFFGTRDISTEVERQEALLLFSQSPKNTTLSLAKTFQHLILARVWDRIVSQASNSFLQSQAFTELHEVVQRLNTLRNIYMLLTVNLVRKLTANISNIYKQSITSEDAQQIGFFGVARAAYRYHPSTGIRFSTYAANWILKEIQRQSLQGRLIRVSSNVVEQFSRAARNQDKEEERSVTNMLAKATAQLTFQQKEPSQTEKYSFLPGPADIHEEKEMRALLIQAINAVLSEKSADMIKRRYGLGAYRGTEQSVIEIGKVYGVTRSNIYQLEQSAVKKLKKFLSTALK